MKSLLLVLLIPATAMLWSLRKEKTESPPGAGNEAVNLLASQLQIRNGTYRGSAVSLCFIPGGDTLAAAGLAVGAPLNKDITQFGWNYGHSFGRDFSVDGFWRHDIPTLEDVSHLQTPFAHYVFSRTLSNPQDFHSRNWQSFTRPNIGLLAALGCRLMITDLPTAWFSVGPSAVLKNDHNVQLRIYELSNPNLGQYSPTNLVVVASAGAAVRMMSGEFDYQRSVVVKAGLANS